MAKKRKDLPPEESPITDYYDLKTQAVDDLATADETNSPQVSQEELQKYRGRKGKGLPEWLKLGFIKFWFPAAVCYFFLWGLSLYLSSMLDLLFVTGLALGAVTDILTNNALRFFAQTEGANDKWMMFPRKGFFTLFQNIFYAFVLLFLVYSVYVGINRTFILLTGASPDTVFLGVEPILFGVFYLGADQLLIWLKGLLVRTFRGGAKKPKQ